MFVLNCLKLVHSKRLVWCTTRVNISRWHGDDVILTSLWSRWIRSYYHISSLVFYYVAIASFLLIGVLTTNMTCYPTDYNRMTLKWVVCDLLVLVLWRRHLKSYIKLTKFCTFVSDSVVFFMHIHFYHVPILSFL